MKITPTEEFIQKNQIAISKMIAAGGEIDYSKGIQPFTNSQNAVDLGMENVPSGERKTMPFFPNFLLRDLHGLVQRRRFQ